MAVGDFNGDGRPDLAVANEFSYNVAVFLGTGDGTFQPARFFATDRGALAVSVGDVNGDGRQDLAVANYGSTTVSVLVGNGDGTFQAAQNFGVGNAPAFVSIADFNADGQPDLAVANYYGPSISVFINTTALPQAATPTFDPPGGTYVVNLTVSISDATPGATIYYTTDGSTPTTSSAVYTGPILLGPLSTTTIKAIAVAPGRSQSTVASATYTVTL